MEDIINEINYIVKCICCGIIWYCIKYEKERDENDEEKLDEEEEEEKGIIYECVYCNNK